MTAHELAEGFVISIAGAIDEVAVGELGHSVQAMPPRDADHAPARVARIGARFGIGVVRRERIRREGRVERGERERR